MAIMPWPGAVAVSGGGDSIALMHLLADWARAAKAAPPLVLCVDHGLRPESAREAKTVARWAKQAGLKSEILTVTGKKPKSDIEAWARQARYRLMADALIRHRLASLYLAHHQDDQAETFLLRLARGSGLDGLSAMRNLSPFPLPDHESLILARPLLDVPREALRSELKIRGRDWLEDPMNAEARFARSRMRALLPVLAEAGLSTVRISQAAAHLARAREALELATAAVLARACRLVDGVLLLDPEALAAAPREIGLRALAALLKSVSGESYRPRFESLERLFDRIKVGGGATLHGCHVAPAPRARQVFGPKTLVIMKESSRKTAKSAVLAKAGQIS
ncbi:MAG TPA: tRNA lysidine(34) synthetase TilS [Rhizomicrobium sp.]|jgi:tRNA(Ile)-lysidine synthase|nr:tRNA lysidine(34) synthetase TilS [Rhizomicrobium sp.]